MKFVPLSFVLFPNKYFFNLHLLTLLLPFLSDDLGDTKTIRPFALRGHGSRTDSASPHGLLIGCMRYGYGVWVYLLIINRVIQCFRSLEL